jgi:hypothetical protein
MTEKALIYAIHRTHHWWRHLGDHLGYPATVLTDRRGQGDRWVTDDFYRAYRRLYGERREASALLAPAEVEDVIARCRVLRWLPRRRAAAMALAMAEAMETVLDEEKPTIVTSFTIDSYVSDILCRRAKARGVPHLEMTASALPGMAMIVPRGRLAMVDEEPDPDLVDRKVHEMVDPLYAPTCVPGPPTFTAGRFLRTLTYFRVRAAFFKAYSWYRRDRLNLHYLDAQPILGHKARYKDVGIVRRIDADWRDRLAGFPKERRIFVGLQLFPEASIDYWIEDRGLVQFEDMLVEVAEALSRAGFLLLVKDHPLQFGFRQIDLLDRLKALANVVVVPHEVTSNEMLTLVGTNFTTTGTPGLQSAMLGLKSIAVPNYYTTDDEDFVLLHSRAEIPGLAGRLLRFPQPRSLEARQRRIVAKLLRGSFDADFFSFQRFDPARPPSGATALGKALGERLLLLKRKLARSLDGSPAA